jgi:short-subunit dehydrogenase
MKVVLITGASGGIGEAVVNKFAERCQNVLLVARNAQKLELQCSALKNAFGIEAHYIAIDLSKAEAPEQIFAEVQKRDLEIEVLINNAGIGSGGEFAGLELKAQLELIQLNVSSLVAMTRLFLPHMHKRQAGTIINMASMAAFMPIPYMATYGASKAFVRSFTEAITEECKPHGVRVILFSPGLTKTNFNSAAGIDNAIGKGLSSDYEGSSTQTPEEVAAEVMQAFDQHKTFAVSGWKNRLAARMTALVPNSMIAKRLAKMYKNKSAR